jgi:YebC/PmpR family DNA-binding regulatory protein
MAGHSQFKNIMYRKGAQDKKRAQQFTKATREIMVAVKEAGPDPESNARLRSAIIAARDVNMPKDNIERAIARAAGGDDTANFQDVRYEGYGLGGVAIIVDGLTDNRNRTAAEVRSIFTKYGGNLGESNSVSFQFDRVGEIVFPTQGKSEDQALTLALEAGATDVVGEGGQLIFATEYETFSSVREALVKAMGDPVRASIFWKPKVTVSVGEDQARTLLKMIDALDDLDDVQSVSANFDIDDSVMQKLSQG